MPDPFVHLHVASGYSLRYGASHPHVLVERAAEQEMDTLALTDRDGTYGAVRFVKAAQQAGIRPVLGVDLAYSTRAWAPGAPGAPGTPGARRGPVRGGAFREQGLPRAVFLASGKAGWASLCRLVSATHLAGERGRPVATPELITEHCSDDVLVLLGASSTLGDAATARRPDRAREVLARWRDLVPRENLIVEITSHRLAALPQGWGPGSTTHAARMLGAASEAGLTVVLTNAVRYADRLDAPTIDVLDAARTLVPLGSSGLSRIGPSGFRGNAEGYLKSGKQMHEIAEEICRQAGVSNDAARDARALVARTRASADRCALDPCRDLGIGEIHFPEFSVSRRAEAPAVSTDSGVARADSALRARCEAAIGWRYGNAPRQRIWKRLDDELAMIGELGYASYFLTVGDVVDLIRTLEVRAAARGSGAGSLVNYLLGISGVDPIRHGLLMERFLSPLRQDLPDIDIDVESARRLEVYDAILDRYGAERCVCVSMMETYRVRHAVRDVGAALGMPPGEIDAIAKAFPHIRARDARMALRDLPELRSSGFLNQGNGTGFDLFFGLVERLDGLPRHIAMHPCGVLLSDATLLDRTPVEASHAGYPMSQFDKDDVEDLGLLKLDVLGIRMQSAMAHALVEIKRVDGVEVDLDSEAEVPFDDDEVFEMISESRTLGVFQIESPGQRELVGKSGIDSFADIITDISLFRPGPVKSDMITPYLEAKQGWRMPSYLHDDLKPILSQTHGVVVFHEQVIEIIAQFAGVSYAEADEKRRSLGDVEGMAETKLWFFPRCLGRGYSTRVAEQIWRILEAFASFGFCKAHAAAFALPTYQSAWLKAHWPAHFLAGVLTHDPGMYPKRLILDDARQFGVAVLGLDVNRSEKDYTVERLVPEEGPGVDKPRYGIRLALAEVKGINGGEVQRIVAARGGNGQDATHFQSLTDFWHRTAVSRPVVERLVLAGGFDDLYGIGSNTEVRRRGAVTRRDLLLQVAELDRHARSAARSSTRGRGLSSRGITGASRTPRQQAADRADQAAVRSSSDPRLREEAPATERHALGRSGVWAQASAQSRATTPPPPVTSVQLALELGDEPREGEASGLPEMDVRDKMLAELEILGLDVSQHVVEGYREFLDDIGVVRSKDLLSCRSRSGILVAGVKVATQTPPIRSGRRVIFLTLDDSTGPVDATFFEDAQGSFATTVFGSWQLVVRGELRRTGRRGVSVRATGCWELPQLYAVWRTGGLEAVRAVMDHVPDAPQPEQSEPEQSRREGPRRVLVHSSGFRMSPYADIRPAGGPTDSGKDIDVPRKLWHRSPGSSG